MHGQSNVVTTVYAESVNVEKPTHPIPVFIVDPISENREINNDMMMCYSLGKTVKLLSIIDIFFSCIYALYNPYFFIPIFISFSGYYGAKKYYTCPTLTYFLYNFFGNIIRIGYSIYFFSNIDTVQQNNYTFSFILSIFCGLVGLWIARVIYRFYTYMSKLSRGDLEHLRLLQYYRDYRVIIW